MDEPTSAFLAQVMQERVGGRYVVERLLGAGGMGIVAAAQYPELGQEVAIKFMRRELAADETLSARFLREARLAARAKSPHFVRVFDFGRLPSGIPYLVMEMLSGRDLGEEIQARGRLPVEEAVDYTLQAAVGLAEIHGFGIVHRDLKPGNLFIAEAAGTRTLKVLDLGLSTEGAGGARGLTTTGNTFGTPHYMSPEQIRESKTVDARSDIWALGIILSELLTGTLPYGQSAGSAGEVFGLILHTAPVPPRQQRADLPEALEEVILRCLRRAPEERFADLGEFADALRRFAGPSASALCTAVRAALGAGPAKAAQPQTPASVGALAVAPPAQPLLELATAPTKAVVLVQATPPRELRRADQPLAMQAASGPQSADIPKVRRGWLVIAGVGAALIGAAATIALARAGNRGDSLSAGASMASVEPSAAPVPTPTEPARLEPLPIPAAAADAGVPRAAASKHATPTNGPLRNDTSSATRSSTPRAATAAPAATPASVLDNLDRK